MQCVVIFSFYAYALKLYTWALGNIVEPLVSRTGVFTSPLPPITYVWR